jgi:hypothetical protein
VATIDLLYARPSCESCAVVRQRLAATRTPVAAERSTREPFTAAEVRALLLQVDEVWIARGRKVERRRARDVRPDDLRGPTGGFRAPMLRAGRRLLVGLHRESLEALLG